MNQFSTDGDGINQVITDDGIVFDRLAAVTTVGWSTRSGTTSRFRTINETTGRTREYDQSSGQ